MQAKRLTGLVLSFLTVYFLVAWTGQPGPDTTIPHGMVLIPAGTFDMGITSDNADEGPVHAVKLKSFLLDRYEVTNRQFSAFVEATGHVTQAERDGYAWGYLAGNSDFQSVKGANWRRPEGPDSDVTQRMEHPVVCVSWQDAAAYAGWAGKRLPTEAEWEYAARAGAAHHFKASFKKTESTADGGMHHHVAASSSTNDLSPSAKQHRLSENHHIAVESDDYIGVQANYWQGTWPENNQLLDGFYYTAPGGRFEANSWDVYDMLGNVWEWTADWYADDYYQQSPSNNPAGPQQGENRVARGGSWFCSPNYCGAYNTSFRGASPPNNAFNNVGFRCAADIDQQRNN